MTTKTHDIAGASPLADAGDALAGKGAERPFGIVPEMCDRDYHAIDAASHSRLVKLRGGKTPAHCRYAIDNPEDTDALLVGAAFHCITLQEGNFTDQFTIRPDCDRRTKDGKAVYESYLATVNGRRELTPDQAVKVSAMSAAVKKHPAARVLLNSDGDCELSVFWNDPEHRILCKARFDKVAKFSGAKPCIVDLKSTEDASPEEFAKSVYSWGYHIQAAHYLYGAEMLGLNAAGFAIIAVEKKPPHAVAVYELDNKAIGAGWQELQPLLAKYAECVKTNNWPAYSGEPQKLSLPDWAFKKLEGGFHGA